MQFQINETYSESRSVSIDFSGPMGSQRITVGANRNSPHHPWSAPCVYYNDVIYQSSLPDFMKALLAVFKQYEDHFVVDKELVDTLTVE